MKIEHHELSLTSLIIKFDFRMNRDMAMVEDYYYRSPRVGVFASRVNHPTNKIDLLSSRSLPKCRRRASFNPALVTHALPYSCHGLSEYVISEDSLASSLPSAQLHSSISMFFLSMS